MLARSAPMSGIAERAAWTTEHTAGGSIDRTSAASDTGSVHEMSASIPPKSRYHGATEGAERSVTALDAVAFDAQLLTQLPPAYGYALRLMRNKADAEDLVLEAALLACRGSQTFEAGTNFKAWFFRSLVRCFHARHRTAKRRPETVELDDTPDVYLYGNFIRSGLPSADPAGALIDRLGTERVVEAIQALPTEYGLVCTLYFMEDLPYHEIADVLDIPVGTVRSRLHRGRKMLQKALWQAALEAGVISALIHEQEQRT
jgi:RNA polymerase sigma-70 factor (ECF subfamily)